MKSTINFYDVFAGVLWEYVTFADE